MEVTMNRRLWAAFLLGMSAQLFQVTVLRELMVAFWGSEMAIGVFYGAWLAFAALGSFWFAKKSRGVGGVFTLLSVLVLTVVCGIRAIWTFIPLDPLQPMPLYGVLLAVIAASAPLGIMVGAGFPLLCAKVESDQTGGNASSKAASQTYVYDAFGCLIGGALVSLWFAQHAWAVRGVSLGVAALAGALALIQSSRVLSIVLCAAALILGVSPLGKQLEEATEGVRLRQLSPQSHIVQQAWTKEGHLVVSEQGGLYSLWWDGAVSHSWPEPERELLEASILWGESGTITDPPQNILVIGGAFNGWVKHFLRAGAANVVLYERDPELFERLLELQTEEDRGALRDPRVRVEFGDVRQLIFNSDARFDLAVVAHSVPENAAQNRMFTAEMMQAVKQALRPLGVACLRGLPLTGYPSPETWAIDQTLVQTGRSVFESAALEAEKTGWLCLGSSESGVTDRGDILNLRWSTAVGSQNLALLSLFPRDETDRLMKKLLDTPVEINTDERPSIFAQVLLRSARDGKAYALFSWFKERSLLQLISPVLALLIVGIVLFRGDEREERLQKAATKGLWLCGCGAMGLQLTLLYRFQVVMGSLFSQVALLTGLMMAGLALGAALGQRFMERHHGVFWLCAVMAMSGAYGIWVPFLMEEADLTLFYVLSTLLGVFAGLVFTLSTQFFKQNTGGLANAADSLGGAIGGILGSLVMIPFFGLWKTSVFMGILFFGASGLMMAALVRRRPFYARLLKPWPSRWSTLWTTLALTAIFYKIGGIEIQSAPKEETTQGDLAQKEAEEPKIPLFEGFKNEFLPADLEALVPGSKDWKPLPGDFVAYQGELNGEPLYAAATAQLAGDIRGFAGPLNLLVVLDAQRKLVASSVVESKETPGFLKKLPPWLQKMEGTVLGQGELMTHLDGMSGATFTGRAAALSIERLAQSLKIANPGEKVQEISVPFPWIRVLVVCAMIIGGLWVLRLKKRWIHLLWLGGSLLILGVWLNHPVTLQGIWGLAAEFDLWGRPTLYLVAAFALVGGLFGRFWCRALCPFGAAQELCGAATCKRFKAPKAIVWQWCERVRYPFLCLIVIDLTGILGDLGLSHLDPMESFFAGPSHWTWYHGVIYLAALGGSIFIYRFWCRAFCPVGGFLEILNRIGRAFRQHTKG